MAVLAVFLTLAAIRAGVARILTACVGKVGKGADYDHEARAFVLTPVHADGSPSWRSQDDRKTERDAVVRVYASAVSEDEFTVTIGVKPHGAPSDRKACVVTKLSRSQAETLLTGTVLELASGKFTGPLSSHVPNVKTMRVRYVERPDQQSTGRKGTSVATLANDAEAAMQAAILAAEAAETATPADKPKAETPKASGSK